MRWSLDWWRSPSGVAEDRNGVTWTRTGPVPWWRSPSVATEDRNGWMVRVYCAGTAVAVSLRGD